MDERQVMTKLGLTLNEDKTSVRDARTERFDFLGYTFGPHHYRKDGHWYLGASPSKKSVRRQGERVRSWFQETRHRGRVCGTLNSLLRGWSFVLQLRHTPTYRTADDHVYHSVELPDTAP